MAENDNEGIPVATPYQSNVPPPRESPSPYPAASAGGYKPDPAGGYTPYTVGGYHPGPTPAAGYAPPTVTSSTASAGSVDSGAVKHAGPATGMAGQQHPGTYAAPSPAGYTGVPQAIPPPAARARPGSGSVTGFLPWINLCARAISFVLSLIAFSVVASITGSTVIYGTYADEILSYPGYSASKPLKYVVAAFVLLFVWSLAAILFEVVELLVLRSRLRYYVFLPIDSVLLLLCWGAAVSGVTFADAYGSCNTRVSQLDTSCKKAKAGPAMGFLACLPLIVSIIIDAVSLAAGGTASTK